GSVHSPQLNPRVRRRPGKSFQRLRRRLLGRLAWMAPSTEEIRYLVTDPHSGADRSGNMLQMLHHVALEVRPDQIEPDRRFWVAVGFVEVPAAPELGAGYTWFEREGTQ